MSTATLDRPKNRLDDLPRPRPGTSYSLARAIQRAMDDKPVDGIEGEMSKALERIAGREAGAAATGLAARGHAFYAPLFHPVREKRDVTTSTGAGALAQSTDYGRFIEAIRTRSLAAAFGAQIIPDLPAGSAAFIPRMDTGAVAAFVSEGNAPAESADAVGHVAFHPFAASAFVDISRTLMSTSGGAAEQLVIGDIGRALAVAIDQAAMVGGGANEPTGLLADPDVPTFEVGTNGGPLTWAEIAEIEEALGLLNTDAGRLGWITTPQVRRQLRTTEKVAGSGIMVWTDDNRIAGYPAGATRQLPSDGTKGTGTGLSSMIAGNWNDLTVGLFTGVEILIDPYTFSTSGTIRVVGTLIGDAHPRHAESFVKILDIDTAS